MNLKNSVEAILGRPLTSEQLTDLNQFKNQFAIDEADPIVVVLALVSANKVLMEEMPKLLQQKAAETIELHRQTLITQSSLIAKELIHVLASSIDTSKKTKDRIIPYAISFFMGAVSIGMFFVFLRH